MTRLILVLTVAILPWQTPSQTTAVQAPAAQRPERNPTVERALGVLDSVIPLTAPRALSREQARVWTQQTDWFKTLRERIRTLLSLVVAPAKVPTPAPIDPKNITALQEEAEKESLQLVLTSELLKARQAAVMEAIGNLK